MKNWYESKSVLNQIPRNQFQKTDLKTFLTNYPLDGSGHIIDINSNDNDLSIILFYDTAKGLDSKLSKHQSKTYILILHFPEVTSLQINWHPETNLPFSEIYFEEEISPDSDLFTTKIASTLGHEMKIVHTKELFVLMTDLDGKYIRLKKL